MMARNVEERALQVLRWCESRWPTPYPVKLHWRKELLDKSEKYKKDQPYHAETFLDTGVIRIYLSRKLCRHYTVAVDTILHEYAHARDWRHARVERGKRGEGRKIHGPEWGLFYAEHVDAFYDQDGWKESREF